MAHCYPFFFAGISVVIVNVLNQNARRIAMALMAWLGSLMFLYVAYLSYKTWENKLFSGSIFFISLTCLLLLWNMGKKQAKPDRADHLMPVKMMLPE
jgi:hypothetical protein